jgi:hypothetical protein
MPKHTHNLTSDLSGGLIPSACLLALAFYGTAALAQDGPEESAATDGGDTDTAAEESAGETKEESKRGSFLVLPIFITEPAIGEGLGAGVVYFHKKDSSDKPRVSTANSVGKTGKKMKPPPTATGAFGFYTSNDTAGVGVGHANSFKDDKYRVVGALANMRINSEIFLEDIPFGFQLAGNLAYGNIKRRMGTSNIFFGMSLLALDADIIFKIDPGDTPPVDLADFALTNVGIAGSAIYDARDNSTMPNTGQLIDFTLWRYDDAIGSDFDYWRAQLKVNSFHQLHKKFVLAWRIDASTVDGSPPFFAVPFVSLRGIPALRYQAKTAGAFEVEGRYNFSERWAGIAFAGAGFTKNDEAPLETTQNIKSVGTGVRFQALREQNIWLGLDIAKGPEEYAWYIQIGQGW